MLLNFVICPLGVKVSHVPEDLTPTTCASFQFPPKSNHPKKYNTLQLVLNTPRSSLLSPSHLLFSLSLCSISIGTQRCFAKSFVLEKLESHFVFCAGDSRIINPHGNGLYGKAPSSVGIPIAVLPIYLICR